MAFTTSGQETDRVGPILTAPEPTRGPPSLAFSGAHPLKWLHN